MWNNERDFYHLNISKNLHLQVSQLTRHHQIDLLHRSNLQHRASALAYWVRLMPLNFTYHDDRFAFRYRRCANDVIDHTRKGRAYLGDFVAKEIY